MCMDLSRFFIFRKYEDVFMPTPKKNESEEDFVARCIPILIREGKTQEQAVAQCHSMYRQAKKVKEGERK